MITIDFETYPIEGNTSVNPPRPVGVAIKYNDKPGKYYAFGHPSENNSTEAEVKRLLHKIWKTREPLLFHNAKFDISVGIKWFGLPMPNPLRVHDTVFLLFLNDPYSINLSLKPSAERLLGWEPEERDRLTDWIMAHTPCTSRKSAGAWIYCAPGNLVGEYAVGDVDRTHALYELLMPRIEERDMVRAYHREQKLMPITYRSELKGVRVDVDKLNKDLPVYESALLKVERKLLDKMKIKELEFTKAEDVANALERAGLVHPDDWVRTPTGRRSTSKDNFPKAIKDQNLLALLRYRGALAGTLQTFARPWAELSQDDGRIHTTWNQVRTHDDNASDADSRGSRTGRLSASKPSLMNVTNELKIVVPKGLPPPPLMRQYLLPEEGHVWLKRDFSSQEVRILAHFEDGTLMYEYQQNPNLDPHQRAADLIFELIGIMYSRKDVKITGFSIIYGSGVNSLAEQLGTDYVSADTIKKAYLRVFPGVKNLQKLVSSRGRNGQSIRTWGGREYYAEPPKIIKGKKMDFSYKLLNYFIQGSAADQTKDCIINWWEIKPEDDVFLATVHDEINISAPEESAPESMRILREEMDADRFDVPFRSEGFVGANWFDVAECHW